MFKDVHPPHELDFFLDSGVDISRSFWDRKNLICHLDIEYVNFDFPHESYLNPERSLRMQVPVTRAAEKVFETLNIQPLHLISGRGHHYVWQIPRRSKLCYHLSRYGRCNQTLLGRYRNTEIPFAPRLPRSLGFAFAGLGRILEYLALMIQEAAAPDSDVPVTLTALETGPSQRGREIVSIDISEYGDPLHTRVIRVPFTAYMKPAIRDFGFNHSDDSDSGYIVVIPDSFPSIDQAIACMQSPQKIVKLAEKREQTEIPEQTQGTAMLLGAYQKSCLRTVHEEFYRKKQHPPGKWPDTYDRFCEGELPPCIEHILQEPNDVLMKPAAIRMVVIALLSLDWHPRHIAGLIRSRYERDFNWGDEWLNYDAATRAEFYVRIFYSAFAAGFDDLLDFNCVSIKERGYCVCEDGECGIENCRNQLLKRMIHG